MSPEIVIFGAGPVGCTFALLARSAGRRVAVCGASSERGPAARHPRPIALSYASRLILERAGAWSRLAVTPIDTVHVSQRAGFGTTSLTSADAGVPALGYVIDYRALVGALADAVRESGLWMDAPAPALRADAALLVHAEGIGNYTTEKSYRQTALVGLIDSDPPAKATAFERFTPQGPLALLPLGGAYGMIWAMRPQNAAALAEIDPPAFLDALRNGFGDRAGRFVSVQGRSTAALALRVRARRSSVREVYVGNSAQTLHPVAGQGLNLGLRDCWDLASCIGEAPDPGAAPILERYVALRRFDALATIRFTDLLAGAFTGTNPGMRIFRGAALTALDACTPAKRFFARRMIFGSSAMP